MPVAGRKTSVALAKLVPFQYSEVLERWMLTATAATPPPGSARRAADVACRRAAAGEVARVGVGDCPAEGNVMATVGRPVSTVQV